MHILIILKMYIINILQSSPTLRSHQIISLTNVLFFSKFPKKKKRGWSSIIVYDSQVFKKRTEKSLIKPKKKKDYSLWFLISYILVKKNYRWVNDQTQNSPVIFQTWCCIWVLLNHYRDVYHRNPSLWAPTSILQKCKCLHHLLTFIFIKRLEEKEKNITCLTGHSL